MWAMNRWRSLGKHKRVKAAAAGGLIVFGSLALSFGDLATTFIAQAMQDPQSVMGQRSPGAREAGALLSTKPAYAGNPGTGRGVTPSQRVLSGARTTPTTLIPGLGTPTSDELATLGNPGPAGFGSGGLPGSGSQFFPGSGPGIGGGGGGGGGGSIGSPGGTTPPANPPVVVPVPEPATWLMMIVGFGMIGAMLRKRRRAAGMAAELG